MVKRTYGVPPPPFPPAPPNPFRRAAPTPTARVAPAAVVEAQQPATSAVAHKAQAIPGVQWQCGPQASGFTAPKADSQPAVDALAEAEYFIDNPSAWTHFDQRASDAIAAVCNAFRAAHGQAPAQAAPAAVAGPVEWRELAARVMDALADAQEQTNSAYPAHASRYPAWEAHARWLRWHADMFRTGKPVGSGAGQPAVLAALAAARATQEGN